MYLDKFISVSNIKVYSIYLDCGWEVIVSGYF